MKKILVDMSAVIIHHGHIRLIKKASKYGKVTIALTTDREIKKTKGVKPELNFSQRKEILSSIKYVTKIIPSPWLINEKFMKKYKFDFLIHGHDNKNLVNRKKTIIFKRTKGISTTLLRKKSCKNLSKN